MTHADRSAHRFTLYLTASLAALLVLWAGTGWAQEVGTIAAVEGRAEIGQGGSWHVATLGAAVGFRDEIRTGRPGRLRIVFRDDTVINVTDDSHLVVDTQVFDPNQSNYQSVIRLLQGKVRALVSDYYQQPRARYEIETATAVAGVRGTEFVVAVDPASDLTEIVGVTGNVAVHSVRDRVGHGVTVTAHELTAVAPGQFPTPPRWLDDALFRQYLDGLDFIGAGQAESLTLGEPLLAGQAVPEPDRAAEAAGPAAAEAPLSVPGEPRYEFRDAGGLIDQSPEIVRDIDAGRGDLGVRF